MRNIKRSLRQWTWTRKYTLAGWWLLLTMTIAISLPAADLASLPELKTYTRSE